VTLDPRNLTAQLGYVGRGNPPSSHPDQAISNCYPGLEFDFRNVWRRIFEGITLHEADNIVIAADTGFEHLVHHRLLTVAGHKVVGNLVGPQLPGAFPDGPLQTAGNPAAVVALEWSNALAAALREHAGQTVTCQFTLQPSLQPADVDADPAKMLAAELRIRPLFPQSPVTEEPLAVIDEALLEPGELTQSLCSPWQNDYRECACYYWAASRPDYVNVDFDDETGTSDGNMWLAKRRHPRGYILDDRKDPRLVTYDELFEDWEGLLRFIVGGRDHE
jgi:hypothetical protein